MFRSVLVAAVAGSAAAFAPSALPAGSATGRAVGMSSLQSLLLALQISGS